MVIALILAGLGGAVLTAAIVGRYSLVLGLLLAPLGGSIAALLLAIAVILRHRGGPMRREPGSEPPVGPGP